MVTSLVQSRISNKTRMWLQFFVMACLCQKGVVLWLYSCLLDELWKYSWYYGLLLGGIYVLLHNKFMINFIRTLSTQRL